MSDEWGLAKELHLSDSDIGTYKVAEGGILDDGTITHQY